MWRIIVVSLVVVSIGCGKASDSAGDLSSAKNREERFYALGPAAKQSFNAGKIDEAQKDAEELLKLLPNFPDNWNYGNAVQDGNLVLGRIAIKAGRFDEAKRRLIAAGNSPGSPQMNSFGPNVSLANDLLDQGERDVVLEYFDLCRKFWQLGPDQLDQWTHDVKVAVKPNFGANLIF
jgi:tetratricopeptide (TPR) repeat protein